MKVLSLLLAAASQPALSSTTWLHKKNALNDSVQNVRVDDPYETSPAFADDVPSVNSNTELQMLSRQRQFDTAIPTFSPTTDETDFPTLVPTSGDITLDTSFPTLIATTAARDTQTPNPSYIDDLYGADDGYIYTTEYEEVDFEEVNIEPHTPNWHPYTPLTTEQYLTCQSDMRSSDANSDSRLNYQEYLNFLSFNSQSNGYASQSNTDLNSYPKEFAVIFHSTACQCAYLGEGEGCCVGENEGIRIFGGQGTGGGRSASVDAGGGEYDEQQHSAVVAVGPAQYGDLDWEELPAEIQAAYTTLGYNETSWDEGYLTPDSEYMLWTQLSAEMQQAALVIGYTRESWDAGRRVRRMERIKYAKDIFDELSIVDGNDTKTVDEDTVGPRSATLLLDEESYTQIFCADGESEL